jgi:hypothetical protein
MYEELLNNEREEMNLRMKEMVEVLSEKED